MTLRAVSPSVRAAVYGVASISTDTTYIVGTSAAAHFSEPGAFTEWLTHRRIMPGVTVTVDIEDGTYTCTKPIRGHVDGARLVWTNDGITGAALTGADFSALDAVWVIDPATGQDATARATNKASAEVIVRAKYNVILEFDGTFDLAVPIDNLHSGDWGDCPCLFINTGTCSVGVSTGSQNTYASGAGGVGIFDGSCFFGFDNVNMLADYGGVISAPGMLSLFGEDECCRSDFNGGFADCSNAIIIGAAAYGWRGNHGGFAYLAGNAYIHGCNTGLESTNSPAMFWAHTGDIQFNRVGVSCSWGGTGKVFDASVKNNAFAQISISTAGTVDSRAIDMVTTEEFDGGPPTYGILVTASGSVNIIPSSGTSTISGHTNDIYLTGAAAALVTGATYTTAKSGNVTLEADPITGTLTVPDFDPDARPAFDSVEIDGTTLTLPDPVAMTISVVQPTADAGDPITISTIDFTSLGTAQEFTIIAGKAATGEVIAVEDSSTVALSAPLRYLSNVRDLLTLYRASSTAALSEKAFKKNQNNASGDQGGVRVVTAAGAVSVTLDDDIVVVNKLVGEATAVALDSGLNFQGREITIKDGKGDAATNNITITPGGTKTVDGAATVVISANYGSVRLVYNNTEWNVL